VFAIIQRLTSSVVLLIWATVLGYFYFGGRISSYLHPAFQVYVGISSVVLALMAFLLVMVPGPAGKGYSGAEPARWMGWVLSIFLLTVPLVVAVWGSPSQFGSNTVKNRGIVQSASDLPSSRAAAPTPTDPALPGQTAAAPADAPIANPSDYLKRNERGALIVQSIDLLYAAQDPDMRKDFEGREIETIGQFMPAHSRNAGGKRFNLVRMFIVCCAADARPVSVTVEAPAPEKFPDMGWVKVEGKATFPTEGGRRVPVIEAGSVRACDPPEETMIY